jgi:CBS domain-containing protein
LSTALAALPEVTRFLRSHPPFDTLDAAAVERVAAGAEEELFPAGTAIFSEGAGPVEHLRVVRRGAVELVHQGRVLDLLGEGEVFGQASMLTGLPAGFEARAVEDTACLRLADEVARELVRAPAGMRFVARSLLEGAEIGGASEPSRDPAHQPVGSLIRTSPVVCTSSTPIQEAAQRMSDAGVGSVVVELGDGGLGIVTDRDLRRRVIAAGLTGSEPVARVMSSPAYTSTPDRLGDEVLLDMLDRGIRHLPIVSGSGRVLGVVEDLDLITVQTRSSFYLRRLIARADSVDELVAAAADLRPMVIALHEARVPAINVMAIYSVVVDLVTRRLLEMAVAAANRPAPSFAWLALGSQARREAGPSSDVDSAIVWFGGVPDEVRPYLHAIGQSVSADLERCGFPCDTHGASASELMFVRSLESWQRAARSWIEDPTQEKALILTSVLVDSRPVWGVHTGQPVADTFRIAPSSPALLRMLARFALSHRPPTGFFRGLVVEHGGKHRGRLDLKHGGVIPITDLARWAAMKAGVTSASTVERLRAGVEAGSVSASDARTLEDAFELIVELRLEHQVEQLRAGQEPDNYVDPRTLSPLTRTHLKEAFRAIAAIQRRLAVQIGVSPR